VRDLDHHVQRKRLYDRRPFSISHPLECMDWKVVVAIVSRILDALAVMHRRGYLHLDVHPGNILLSDVTALDELRLVDYGSAQPVDPVTRLYIGPVRGGKWVYAPPEQINRDPGFSRAFHAQFDGIPMDSDARTIVLDATCDLFSTAAVGVYLLLGRPPFLPLHLRDEAAGKIREKDVLSHPLRDPITLAKCLQVGMR
jgi:serine/threonine protein kinase